MGKQEGELPRPGHRGPNGSPIPGRLPAVVPSAPRQPSTPQPAHQHGENNGRAKHELAPDDPVERLARQLYNNWKNAIKEKIDSGDQQVGQQNVQAQQLIAEVKQGQTTQSEASRKEVRRAIERFDQSALHAVSAAYPPTTVGQTIIHEAQQALTHSDEPLARIIAPFSQNLRHKDSDGQGINSAHDRNEQLHEQLEKFTSGMIESVFEGVPEEDAAAYTANRMLHDIVSGTVADMHQIIERGLQNKRIRDNLIAFHATTEFANGEERVMETFRRIAKLQMKLEDELANGNPLALHIAGVAGRFLGNSLTGLISAAREELRRQREEAQMPPQVAHEDTRTPRQLPPGRES